MVNEAKPQTDKYKTKPLNRKVCEGREGFKTSKKDFELFLRALRAFAVNAFDFQELDSKFKMLAYKVL